MAELTFTEYVQDKIRKIDMQNLADTNNVIGVGTHIAELAQLMARINQELAARMWAYNMKVKIVLEEEKISVAQAKVKVDGSKEAQDLLQVKLLKESVVEMIRSLKYLLRSMKDEFDSVQHT